MASSSSNKRIAVNTVYMYARLFITTAIGLYTSRVVLLVLGVSDYGLFNVVGGVLALFGFITGSLGAATSRFLNAEMGKPDGDVNKVFNINQTLHIIFAAIFFALAESIGLWYICNKLTVAPGKLPDAIFVYQIAILTTCAGIINAPCSSIFSAHEKFGFQSILDITNTIIRLLCVIALQFYNGNHLRFYALIMCFTTANSFIIYHVLAVKWWPEIMRWRFVRGWNSYKPVLSFGTWNLLATASMMARNSGSDIIVNAFFGTITNGVFAVGKSISSYVMTFSSNFGGASGPQIVQSYNAGDFDRCYYLVNKIGRFGLLLLELVLFPIWIELDFVLHLWLKVVPDGVFLLSRINLILAAVAVTSGGIVALINASGKIKWFKIQASIFFLSCLPIGYYLFKIGFPAYSMMVLFIIADFLQRIVQLYLLKKILNFDSLAFIKEAYFRPALIAIIMSLFIYGHSFIQVDCIFEKLSAIVICGLLNTSLIYFLGLTSSERQKVQIKIKDKLGITKYDLE